MEQHFRETINALVKKSDILSLGEKNKLYIKIDTDGFIINIYYNKEKDIYQIEHKYKDDRYIRYYNIKNV